MIERSSPTTLVASLRAIVAALDPSEGAFFNHESVRPMILISLMESDSDRTVQRLVASPNGDLTVSLTSLERPKERGIGAVGVEESVVMAVAILYREGVRLG